MAEFKRDTAKEAAAIARGITKEEIERRGGINASGYYGDSFNPNTSLSDEEYAAAITGKSGTDAGKAINAATEAKLTAYVKANPQSTEAKGLASKDGDGTTTGGIYTASDGTKFDGSDEYILYQKELDKEKAERVSAYDLLLSEFRTYGLEALVTPLKDLIQEGVSPSEFTLRLRETEPYKKRFAANAQRVAKGLRALSEAEYIGTEDQYQDVMRRYGLPESYYAKGDLGVQSGFEKFLAGDVSAVEVEDRIQTAQNRVINANPEVSQALKAFYPGISNGDILAYTLDPTNAIEQIKRKVTAAEIGGAAVRSGLSTNVADAEYLQRYGVTKEQATQGYTAIGSGLQRGSQLASIYGQDPYTQATAEQEIFNVPGAEEARKQRQKITGLEKATFGGQTGASSSALSRDRAGGY
jgi:hypothetical protein